MAPPHLGQNLTASILSFGISVPKLLVFKPDGKSPICPEGAFAGTRLYRPLNGVLRFLSR
jgi:hypothetical protein